MDRKTLLARARQWKTVFPLLKDEDVTLKTITDAHPWLLDETPVKQEEKPVKPEVKPEEPVGEGKKAPSVSSVPGLAKNGASMYANEPIVLPAGAPAIATTLRQAARAYSRADGKKMMTVSVDAAWPVIKKYFGLVDAQKPKFLALMMGQATRESTLRTDIETGTGKGYGIDSAHAYGWLQTAVTAFSGANPTFDQEDDVPELYRYAWRPEHFYDPMISNHMGIRKMLHFCKQAKDKYKVTDKWEVLRLSVQGHNTGHANPGNDEGYMAEYPDHCAVMGHWYLKNNHLSDDVFTWTGNFGGHPTSFPAPIKGADWKQNWTWFWS